MREERRVGGIAERSEHAGHVLQGRVLLPPLRERTRGLSLEIQDVEIPFGPQELPEVKEPLAKQATKIASMGSADYDAVMRSEIAKIQRVVREAKIKLD